MTIDDDALIAEKKRLALSCLSAAWHEAAAEGVDPDIIAHAALFTALSDLVETYGETAVAELAGTLPGRIEAREFSINQVVQ
ncbi:MAG: hypothetical protein ACTSP2_01555 [Alphaproteobacteria bacterium]